VYTPPATNQHDHCTRHQPTRSTQPTNTTHRATSPRAPNCTTPPSSQRAPSAATSGPSPPSHSRRRRDPLQPRPPPSRTATATPSGCLLPPSPRRSRSTWGTAARTFWTSPGWRWGAARRSRGACWWWGGTMRCTTTRPTRAPAALSLMVGFRVLGLGVESGLGWGCGGRLFMFGRPEGYIFQRLHDALVLRSSNNHLIARPMRAPPQATSSGSPPSSATSYSSLPTPQRPPP